MAANYEYLANKRLYLSEQNPACFPEVHRHGLMEKCGSNKEAPSANNADTPSAMSFWKKNSKTVPGWPSPSKESVASWATKSTKSSSGGGGSSSFQVFEDSVRDAWDIEDDEFSVISSSDVKISKKVAQSTALSVINSHRSGAISPTTSSKLDGPHHHHHHNHSHHHHQFLQQPDIHSQSHKNNPTASNPAAPANSTSCLYPGPNANIEVYKSASTSTTTTTSSTHASSSLPNGNAPGEEDCGVMNNVCGGGGGGEGGGGRGDGDGRPIHRNSISVGSSVSSSGKPRVINRLETESEKGKAEKIGSLLEGATSTDLKELQSLSYSGLPVSVRGTTWRLLAGYLPANTERREEALRRKREEYWKCVGQYYDSRKEESHQDTFRQIHIDIPRMCPLIALFQQRVVQELFERILFIWAIRHPASGYVQGMNDLVTPFFVVFLEEVLPVEVEVESFDVSRLKDEVRNNIEADSYWCMSKFLDSIQVNYIFAQTGIQEKVKKLKELIERIDAPLHHHLQRHEIDYLQFSFRWMNNLLMRELPLRCTIRLWDTYLSEPDGCGSVLLYVCAAFLRHWRDQLIRQKDFQGLMLLLQNLPTQNWETPEVNVIVAEAYRLKYTYDNTHWH